MKIAQAVIDSIDWPSIKVFRGEGNGLRKSLCAYLEVESTEEAMDLWWEIEGAAFPQGTLGEATEPIVEVMMAVLADKNLDYQIARALEVIRFILTGGSLDDPGLITRCRGRVKRGEWLLVAMLQMSSSQDEKESILEILGCIDSQVVPVILDSIRQDE